MSLPSIPSQSVVGPTYQDNFISYANSQVDGIVNELKDIQKNLEAGDIQSSKDKLINIEKKIEETVKILKRSMKGESHIENMKTIEKSLSRLNESYNKVFEKLNIAEHSLKTLSKEDVKARTKEMARVLHGIKDIQDRATKKIRILDRQASFEVSKLQRFDRILNERPSINTIVLGAVISKIQLKNEAVDAADYQVLQGYHDHPELLKIETINVNKDEFQHFMKELMNEIESAGKRKNNLLKDLSAEMKSKEPLSEEDKLKYTIHYRQITNNPFEIPLLKDFYGDRNVTKKDFLDDRELIADLTSKIPDLETKKIPYSDATLKYKLEGLKKIQQEAKKDSRGNADEEVLISGAGPGGLMFGLIASLQGRQFTIVESRKENDSTSRNNILALGKDDSLSQLPMLKSERSTGGFEEADLKLLDFFGVTDRLISEGLASNDPSMQKASFSARIGDLQNVMLLNLQSIEEKKEPVVLYNTRIEAIKPGDKGEPAKVKLSNEAKERTPSVVYVMEGYRTTTRDLLGIDTVKQSKAALMGVSFFEMKKAQTSQDKFVQAYKQVTDVLRSVPDVLTILTKSSLFAPSNIPVCEKVFNTIGRAEILLRTPDSDYFYFTLSGEDINIIKEYKAELANAQKSRDKWTDSVETFLKDNSKMLSTGSSEDAFNFLTEKLKKSSRREWYKEADKTKQVFDKIKIISDAFSEGKQPGSSPLSALQEQFAAAVEEAAKAENAYNQIKEEIAKKIAKPGRRTMDLLQSGSTRHSSYTESEMSASQVQRAEANYRRMGETHFYVGGDAESTTDPVSGAGFRTTILRTVIASAAFDHPKLRENPFAQSVFGWASHLAAQSMREEGLNLRRAYISGTERLERYVDMGEEAGALTTDQREFLLKVEGKFKSMQEFASPELQLSPLEITQLETIQKKITEKYDAAIFKLIDDKGHWNPGVLPRIGLSPKEEEMFMKAWKGAKGLVNLSQDPQFDRDMFKGAAAKVAFYRPTPITGQLDQDIYVSDSWFVVLMTLIEQFKQKPLP